MHPFALNTGLRAILLSRYSQSRIGIDLDNTLISYDALFAKVALEHGLIPGNFGATKREIRDHIRRSGEGDSGWQRLQAIVYGPAIDGAILADGALDFIRNARRGGAEVTIVSHKTAQASIGDRNVDLRNAATEWLRKNGMIGPAVVTEDRIFFESTRAEKIARIVALGCTHFIDDLEEVFDDPTFPSGVQRMLLSSQAAQPRPYGAYGSFREIARVFTAE